MRTCRFATEATAGAAFAFDQRPPQLNIAGVETTVFRSDAAPGDTGSLHTLLELHTFQGITGIAVCHGDLCAPVTQIVESLLVGHDPRGVVGLWQRMLDAAERSGHRAALSAAISALDVALWDLKARINEEPLWKTLGGARPKANAHAIVVSGGNGDEELAQACSALARDFGFRALKLRAGTDTDVELRCLELAYAALKTGADEPVLVLDLESRCTPKESLRKLREIERRFDVSWVENPAASWDFQGLKQVSDGVRAAVCAGDALSCVADFLPHFRHRALDVVEISLATAGITGALQLADCAFGFELPVVLSAAPGNIHAHLASVMPYFMSLEVREPLPAAAPFSTQVRIVDGWAVPGEGRGSGLEIDRAALAEAVAGASAPERLSAP